MVRSCKGLVQLDKVVESEDRGRMGGWSVMSICDWIYVYDDFDHLLLFGIIHRIPA